MATDVSSAPSILVAGVGNIFFSDDGFGVEVARRLSREKLPDGVTVRDFGIRGVHLAYELLNGYEAVVLVDTVHRGDIPGTLYLVEPEAGDFQGGVADAHSLDPAATLSLVGELGGSVDHIVLVGLEPAATSEGIGLTADAEAAVPAAVELVKRKLTEMLATSSGPMDGPR